MTRCLILFIMIITVFSLPVNAYESVDSYITPEIAEYMPDDILTEENLIDYNSFLDSLITYISRNFRSIISHLFVMLGIVILSTTFSVYSNTVSISGISKCFSLLSSVCISVIIYGILVTIWDSMSALLEDINIFMTAITPVTTLLYSMGGNITQATVNNTAMSLILTIFEKICYYGIKPILQVCFGFSIVSALFPNVNLKFISRFIRKAYTSVLIFFISLMTSILTLQNMLTKAGDSFAVKTVKFASSAAIPLVGGSLSQATDTLASGIKSIRTTFGVMAILSILLMVIPWVINLLLHKFSFSVASTLSRVFGLDQEAEMISDAGELLNFALAITVSCSVMFVICIAVFAESTCAIGG